MPSFCVYVVEGANGDGGREREGRESLKCKGGTREGLGKVVQVCERERVVEYRRAPGSLR